MGFEQVSAGKDVPNDINVIIEISAQGDPIKFEVDKDSGAVFVDRFMGTSMRYPLNYGYVPHTVAGDGDPVLVRSGLLTPGLKDWVGEANGLIDTYHPKVVVVLFIGNYSDDQLWTGADGQPVPNDYGPAFFDAWGAEAERLTRDMERAALTTQLPETVDTADVDALALDLMLAAPTS